MARHIRTLPDQYDKKGRWWHVFAAVTLLVVLPLAAWYFGTIGVSTDKWWVGVFAFLASFICGLSAAILYILVLAGIAEG